MTQWILAGSMEELVREGPKLIKGGIVVFAHESEPYAIDNRCPHMGFPLHMGSLCDGILTCHWHHARFDVCSGGTLDPWADDVPTYPVKLESGEVWVDPTPRNPGTVEKHYRRLRDGLEQNLPLVIAKSVVALRSAGESEESIASLGIEFGIAHRAGGWSSGFTVLTAMMNIMPKLDSYGRVLALFHGLRRVAADCAGQPARFVLEPLPNSTVTLERLAEWYRQCVEVRDTDGATRILLSAAEQGADSQAIADMMLSAVTDHFFLDGGHTFDFHNKAFEMTDRMEVDQAGLVWSSLVPLLRNPTRSEELSSWRQPIDLVAPLKQAFEHVLHMQAPIREPADFDEEAFVDLLLGDQPLQTIDAITDALTKGVKPVTLGRLAALAAAERINRFHTQNDFGDWITVLHTFTYAHAVHESLHRVGGGRIVRALYDAAVSIYLNRFLNIPAASSPKPEQYRSRGYTTDPGQLLALMDERQQVSAAADWAAHYMENNGDMQTLFQTLGHALLREDAEFHSYQMTEAAMREYDRWSAIDGPFAEQARRTFILALTRYLAAHAPTARELPHVARIAWRLHRGEKLFES